MKQKRPNVFDFEGFLKSNETPEETTWDIEVPDDDDGRPDEGEAYYHHATCRNSRCTTCKLQDTCEVFEQLNMMTETGGLAPCMAECSLYKPNKPTGKKWTIHPQ